MSSQHTFLYQFRPAAAQVTTVSRSAVLPAGTLLATAEARMPIDLRPGAQAAENDVSIGPLLSGVLMMLLVRRHRH